MSAYNQNRLIVAGLEQATIDQINDEISTKRAIAAAAATAPSTTTTTTPAVTDVGANIRSLFTALAAWVAAPRANGGMHGLGEILFAEGTWHLFYAALIVAGIIVFVPPLWL